MTEKIITVNTTDTNLVKDFDFVPNYKIKFGHSSVGGRGVFATADIEESELIERCPLVALEHRSKYQADQSIWRDCYTKPPCDCSECKNPGYMVLGHCMIYNHQDDNNADMKFNHKDLYVDIIANRPIKKDKEIFVTYGKRYFKNREKVVVENAIN